MVNAKNCFITELYKKCSLRAHKTYNTAKLHVQTMSKC